MPAAAGHDARVSYLWEDDGSGNPDFATSSPDDSDYKPFGSDATLNTLEGSNNAVRAFDPNDREAREVIEQQFSGSWSVEFTLTNGWWLRGLLHNGVSTSGSTPYSHSIDGDVPYSMQIIQGTEATGHERTLLGCVVSSGEISASVDGFATVSLEGAYADESFEKNATLQSQPTIDNRPLHFGQATLQRDSSTLSLIQNASVSIENNIDLIRELGSRFAVDYSPKVRSVDVSYGDIVEDSSEVERMYGSSGSTSPQSTVENTQSLTFTFDNGDSGSSKNSIQLSITGGFPNTYSRSGIGDPEADLEGTLNEMAASVSATLENDSSTAR